MGIRFTAAVITKNEEQRIAACLKSVAALADELLVVDSGSEDRTVEIAKGLGARVIVNPFEGHVQQKNFAMNAARNDWILSLDADEELSETAQKELASRIETPGEAAAFSFNRRNNYCGTWLRHGGWYPDRKIRFWDRRKGQWGGWNPHDEVLMDQGVRKEHLNGDILHYTYDKEEDHLRQMRYFSSLSAQTYFEKGRRTHSLEVLLNPAFSFLRDYFFRGGFRDGRAGWRAAGIATRYQYWKYKKLLALQRGRAEQPEG